MQSSLVNANIANTNGSTWTANCVLSSLILFFAIHFHQFFIYSQAAEVSWAHCAEVVFDLLCKNWYKKWGGSLTTPLATNTL
jgi:hypothetical protein